MESCFHSNSLYWLGEQIVVIYLRLLRVWSIRREESLRPGNSRLVTLEISDAVVEHCVTSFNERFIHLLTLLLSTWYGISSCFCCLRSHSLDKERESRLW